MNFEAINVLACPDSEMQDGFVLDQVAVATGQPIRPTLLSTGERDHGTNRITFANRPNQLYRQPVTGIGLVFQQSGWRVNVIGNQIDSAVAIPIQFC